MEPVRRRGLLIIGLAAGALVLGVIVVQGLWSITHLHSQWVDRTGGTTTAVADVRTCVPKSASMISFRNITYLRDPDHVLTSREMTEPYQSSASLPADARFTGYSRGDWHLWVSPGDHAAVFIRTPDGVERWPEAQFACG